MKYSSPLFTVYLQSKFHTYFSNRKLLLILLFFDFLLMLVHALSSLGILPDHYYSYIANNFSYGETYQYIKCLFLCIITIKLFMRLSQPILLLWAAIFLYILLDDSLEIHELLGGKLATLSFVGNKTLGEFLVFTAIGIILLLPVFILHGKLRQKYMIIFDQDMAILFILLVLAGVGVDVLHDFTISGTFERGILTLMEDGGEMVALSLIVWYVFNFYQEHKTMLKP